jgi:hypothetical protein
MVKHLQPPFRIVLDGTIVAVTEDNCAIMMKNSALEAITIPMTVLVKKREAHDDNNNVPSK